MRGQAAAEHWAGAVTINSPTKVFHTDAEWRSAGIVEEEREEEKEKNIIN